MNKRCNLEQFFSKCIFCIGWFQFQDRERFHHSCFPDSFLELSRIVSQQTLENPQGENHCDSRRYMEVEKGKLKDVNLETAIVWKTEQLAMALDSGFTYFYRGL